MLVIFLTRPREGRILSVFANLEPNHLAQFQPKWASERRSKINFKFCLSSRTRNTTRNPCWEKTNSCNHSHSYLGLLKYSQNVAPRIQAKPTPNFRGPTELSNPSQNRTRPPGVKLWKDTAQTFSDLHLPHAHRGETLTVTVATYWLSEETGKQG